MATSDRHPSIDHGLRGRRVSRLLVAALAAATLATACGDADDASSEAETEETDTSTTIATTTTAPSSTTAASSADESAADADSAAVPVRAQLDWVVGFLNDSGDVPTDELEQRFSPAFLAEVPADQLAALVPQLFSLAEPPYSVESFEPSGDGLAAEAILLGMDNRRLAVELVVAATAPNQIEGLLLTPAELEFPSPITVDAIDDRLSELAPQSSLGVYDVTDGVCSAVHEIRTDATIVLGSVFKLWVLAALAHEVDEGRASWDETMLVTDQLRSTPNGDIYEMETGTEVSLQRLAEAMISISDNTATDMLLDRVGRPAVEAVLEPSGVADPGANIPMLSTGNLFALKFVPEAPNADDYRVLDETGRRALLEELDGAVLPWVGLELALNELLETTNADGLSTDEPRGFDIEWFATAADLCRTLVYLSELAETPGLEPVASILELADGGGLPFDRDRWPTVRFKGGSEPGVVAGAWWFEGPDGDRYVVAGGVANPDTAVNDLDTVLLLGSAIELIE